MFFNEAKLNESKVQWWDAHCHLSFLDDEQLEVFFQFPSASQGFFLQGGYDLKDWEDQLKINHLYPDRISLCFGLHPWVLTKLDLSSQKYQWKQLLRLADRAQFIGETGLDFSVTKSGVDQSIQEQFFIRHLSLAAQIKCPLILHIVNAHEIALKILRHHSLPPKKGILHGFTRGPELARQYIDLGFFISVGPHLLHCQSHQIKKMVREIDLQFLVIETDLPKKRSMPLSSHSTLRSKITDSWDLLSKIAKEISLLKEVPIESVIEQNIKNLQFLRG